ncbi:MAG: Nif11-like leader peptide family natural product precursor [Firmicutes bacterium]|nr:Nif11-like leader peptide family natural product precursor [Bacillota bacterium]
MAKEKVDVFIKKISEDKAFGDKVFSAESAEDVQQLSKNEGIELSSEDMQEVQELMKQVVQYCEKQDQDELSDDDLDGVAGGFTTVAIGSGPAGKVMSGGYTKEQIKNQKWLMNNGNAIC